MKCLVYIFPNNTIYHENYKKCWIVRIYLENLGKKKQKRNLKLFQLSHNMINGVLGPCFQYHEATVTFAFYGKTLCLVPNHISKCFHNTCMNICTISPLELSNLNVIFYPFKSMDNFISFTGRYNTLHHWMFFIRNFI